MIARLTIVSLGITAVLCQTSCDQEAAASEKASSSESPSTGAISQNSLPEEIDFNIHVRPILSDTCFHCHGPDSKNQKGDFALHTFADATKELVNAKGKYGIVPGKPEESEIIARVFSEDEEEIMPPADSIHKLTSEQKDILKRWVEQGAKYKKHWAFIPPKKQVPEKKSDWAKDELDLFIAAKHQELGLKHSPEASPEVWLRRTTLSLTGLQPTPEELEAFIQDKSPEAKEKVVDRLLDSPRYGEHMAVAWMEAARYADTDGYQNDHERQNWPWRDYVIKAFNENKGFDQFTIEQLAGDMLPNATHEQVIATAFNRNHRQNAEGGALAEEFIIENILDRVDTVGTIYFGLTMSCARCHDHKYDPLSQKEVFQFSSYFNNINEAATARGTSARPTTTSLSLYASEESQQIYKKVQTLNAELNKVRGQQRGLLAKQEPKLKGKALNDKAESTQPVKELKQQINQLNNKIKANGDAHYASVMIMREAQGITPTYLLERGQYTDPDKSEELTRTVPAALLGDEPAPKDRLELAKWIVSDKNPITARVIVNRIWMHHFGTGIVSTPEDFGSQAPFPTHPKLLDYLAVEFRQSGWDMKALHKRIVLSATYGQSSKLTAELLEKDSTNKWLARGPRFRLSGYALRDQALHAAGLLTEKLGGPSVKPYQPDGLWNSMSHSPNIRYRPSTGDALYRRSLYTYWKRAVNPPRQSIFDGSGREICSVTQNRTNTPLQALVLMNDVTFLEAAKKVAERALLDTATNHQQKLKSIYTHITGYDADQEELNILSDTFDYFNELYTADPEAAKSILTQGASQISESADKAKLAAYTAVAHVVLNTDESINIE
ncbi:Planctomycete cytochrome C [Rubritalea squalenifaciens DSM 18772]|uniref:Planctomycete cytochrome C n=1 Tax=Rubritalea squalenifaciens DSM 18772 TaxID=1123071 RepID=A0A1M6B1Y1_9BACT|nr:PSD1 and planctomycete cytochrome C domain-containing protein [Rubritalea squalenifaciens]SHI42598.1 Planctomycete cytochrome C [Rubritalea squalenifaciens DSM 18772]